MAVMTTPPRILNMEEYQSQWKPLGWQAIFATGLAYGYLAPGMGRMGSHPRYRAKCSG